jgi:H+/Cl- antiporter ClcA
MNARMHRYVHLGGLSVLSGALAGVGAWIFLVVLDLATEVRLGAQWLVLGLPLAGVAMTAVVMRVSARSAHGNALVFREIERVDEGVPTPLAPIVVVGTWLTHLFGGSAGREGTALQMSASLTDAVSRRFRLDIELRRQLLVVALAAGFGAVFGTPLAGVVFAIEVHARWRLRWSALVPSLIAAYVAHSIVGILGYRHEIMPSVSLGIDPSTFAACVVLGLGTGIVATAYVLAVRTVRRTFGRRLPNAMSRVAVGGLLIIALTAAFGTDALGLSTHLSARALEGEAMNESVFLLKLVFTAITAGSGFIGGEVTPLFVMGATFGAAVAGVIGLSVTATSALGFVAVFGAAAHVPLACAVMALELFGVDALPHALVVCIVASLIARHPGLHPVSTATSRT